jgi:hypothetical protein
MVFKKPFAGLLGPLARITGITLLITLRQAHDIFPQNSATLVRLRHVRSEMHPPGFEASGIRNMSSRRAFRRLWDRLFK